MDRDVEEASQGLVSSYHPGEPWPWLCSPCLASGCARFTALDMAWSMPGVGKPVTFPQLWDHQTRLSSGTWSRLGPGENAVSQRTAPGGDTLHQEVPMVEGSASQAVGSRGDCAVRAGCCQQHMGFAGPPACPPCTPQVCRAGGARLCIGTHGPAEGRGFSVRVGYSPEAVRDLNSVAAEALGL